MQATQIQNFIDQRARKVVSDSPGLVDFAIGLENSVFNLPDGQVMFLRNSNNRRTVRSILPFKKLLGLVEMTSGLANVSFSLPEWQAVKMIFFAPCWPCWILWLGLCSDMPLLISVRETRGSYGRIVSYLSTVLPNMVFCVIDVVLWWFLSLLSVR